MVKKKDDSAPVVSARCKFCKLDDETRAGAELIGALGAASWNIAARRINNTFGLSLTSDCVRKHMTQHELTKTALETGVLIDAIRGEDGAPGLISIETMFQTLMVQGMLDLAKGKIRCKSPAELIQVANVLRQIQASKEAQMELESGDAQGFYKVLAAYGEAIRDTVSPEQMRLIVAKANALGPVLDIGHIPIEKPIDVAYEDIMGQAVKDYKTLGRARTRDELVESGALDDLSSLDDELDLPD